MQRSIRLVCLATLCATVGGLVPAVGAFSEPVGTGATAGRLAERRTATIEPVTAVGGEVELECSWSPGTVLDGPATGVIRTRGSVVTAVFTGYRELADGRRAVTVMAIENGEQRWCSDDLARSTGSTAGVGVAWDLDARLVVAVRSDSDITGRLAEAARGGWLENHSARDAAAEGSESVLLATIDPSTGRPIDATFITAPSPGMPRPADLVLEAIAFEGGGFRVDTVSVEPPRRRDGSPFDCPAAARYAGVYVFPPDFSRPTIAAAPGCN